MNEVQAYITPAAMHRAEIVLVGFSFLIYGWLAVVILWELVKPLPKKK